MNAKKKEKLIRALIKDDLINCKLVNSLNEAGLNADNYLLHLSTTIFGLMGIKTNLENEAVFTQYLLLTEKVKYIDISKGHHVLDGLVGEIYLYLVFEKSVLKY